MDAVGGLNTTEVGSLTSTTNATVWSTHDGAAGSWETAAVVESVANWHTRLTLTTDALIEATIDNSSSSVSAIVDCLAALTVALRVAVLSLAGWLELDGLCWIASTRNLAGIIIYSP